MKQNREIKGYLENIDLLESNGRCSFCLENYRGTIFLSNPYRPFPQKIELPDYVFGKTIDNYNICLRITNAREFGSCVLFDALFYVVSPYNAIESNLNIFSEVVFSGGAINCVKDPTKIFGNNSDTDYFEEGYFISFKPAKELSFQRKFVLNKKSVLYSSSIIPYQDRKNNNLGVTNSTISFKPDETVDLGFFQELYFFLSKILTFLVGQQNIDFDKIELRVPAKTGGDYPAFVYVNTGDLDSVRKPWIECISLSAIEKHFDNFCNIFLQEEFLLNFLPERNSDAHLINDDMIKNICTSLEFEYSMLSDKCDDTAISNLITYVTDLVNEYKKTHNEISENTYHTISTSISCWDKMAADQVLFIFNKYNDIIQDVLKDKRRKLTESDIRALVSYRNKITHTPLKKSTKKVKKAGLTIELAETAKSLVYLIYVALLSRGGLDKEEIVSALHFVKL